jgi:hypothetical protein
MTYSLDLFFKPAVDLKRINRYFQDRRYFSLAGNDAVYENPDTKVGFSFTFRLRRNLLLRQVAVSAEFEVKYGRPSWFADEAAIELSAFTAAFGPRIEDSQMRGMAKGPYSGDRFLRAWDFGNSFTVRQIFVDKPDFRMATLPSDRLRAIWAWNYRRAAEHEISGRRRFTPLIQFIGIEGCLHTMALWPRGMPVLLPKVDYVLVSREDGNDERFGLAPWSEVLEVVGQNPRFDVTKDPISLEYFDTPPAITKWMENIPSIDLRALERLPARQVFDAELAAAARESIAIGEIDGAITINPPPRAAVAV